MGCGPVGATRAAQVALHPATEMYALADPARAAAEALAQTHGATAHTDWRELVAHPGVDVVVVATPHAERAAVAIAALKQGKHVLCEAPLGRHLNEAVQLAGVATSAKGRFKIGCNHRYHPGLRQARAFVAAGVIGEVINVRASYGRGGRPEAEWRANRDLAGGGELTDEGVHVLDLVNWFVGEPREVFAYTQAGVWPGNVEDGAFALMKWEDGKIAQLRSAWTQWTDEFCFEVFGTLGSVGVRGLGGDFGAQTLAVAKRRPEGGRPYSERTVYDEEDVSWREEWADFVGALTEDRPYMGSPAEGITVMGLLDALYRSAQSGQAVNP